jgi:hypothetical protein
MKAIAKMKSKVQARRESMQIDSTDSSTKDLVSLETMRNTEANMVATLPVVEQIQEEVTVPPLVNHSGLDTERLTDPEESVPVTSIPSSKNETGESQLAPIDLQENAPVERKTKVVIMEPEVIKESAKITERVEKIEVPLEAVDRQLTASPTKIVSPKEILKDSLKDSPYRSTTKDRPKSAKEPLKDHTQDKKPKPKVSAKLEALEQSPLRSRPSSGASRSPQRGSRETSPVKDETKDKAKLSKDKK